MKAKELIEVHLKRKILWWNGEKLCNVRKISGTLKTLHLEIIDGQSYVVVSFKIPDEYGNDSTQGLTFPIKETTEFIEEFKARQALLPESKKQKILDEFIEDYIDFCGFEDKLHWIPKKIRELLKKKKDDRINYKNSAGFSK